MTGSIDILWYINWPNCVVTYCSCGVMPDPSEAGVCGVIGAGVEAWNMLPGATVLPAGVPCCWLFGWVPGVPGTPIPMAVASSGENKLAWGIWDTPYNNVKIKIQYTWQECLSIFKLSLKLFKPFFPKKLKTKYSPYVVGISNIHLHIQSHANPANSFRYRGYWTKKNMYYQLT